MFVKTCISLSLFFVLGSSCTLRRDFTVIRHTLGYIENMIYLDASAFGYNDWMGYFYTAGMPTREWLTCIFADNHWRGQAASTIRQLRKRLD